MRIDEVTGSHYDPAATYLHGGPQELEGQRLKRFGKHGSDMGALFFCKDTPSGRWYASTYGERVWMCRLKTPVDQIFDLTNPRHRALLQRNVNPQQLASMMGSARNGHLDWTSVDDELFGELGFRGQIFIERPAGMATGLPPASGFTHLPEDVLSVALFHPEDSEIIGSMTRQDVWQSMQQEP